MKVVGKYFAKRFACIGHERVKPISFSICILLRLVCNQILRLPPPCLIAPPLITTHTSHITGFCCNALNLYAKKQQHYTGII